MHYIFGDIHGCLKHLSVLFENIKSIIKDNDTFIFLGDYIDRGPDSFGVIEFLLSISRNYNAVFLKGNHEDMFLKYIDGKDEGNIFLHNGGRATLRSYKNNCGNQKVPIEHIEFFKKLTLYYEYSDFICVHAGFNPKIYNIEDQLEDDMLWIREGFYRANRKWDKTVVFGHTPTTFMGNRSTRVYSDKEKNIIGVDTGAVYGGKLTCLCWPDGRVYQC